MPEPTVPRFALSPVEAAKALGVSRATLYNRLYDGTIRSVKLGNRRLVPIAVIEELLAGSPAEAGE